MDIVLFVVVAVALFGLFIYETKKSGANLKAQEEVKAAIKSLQAKLDELRNK